MKEYDDQLMAKAQQEAKIIAKALADLKSRGKELSKPSPVQYYSSKPSTKMEMHACWLQISSIYIRILLTILFIGDREMLESEFQKWHTRQLKREDALKQVEDIVSVYLKEEEL